MENEENEIYEKNEYLYFCKKCDFKCSYISDWTRHINTRKHLVSKEGNVMEIKNTSQHSSSNICNICNRNYKSISGLWKHKKNCTEPQQNNLNANKEDIVTIKEIMTYLIKENSEMKNLMMEVIKVGTNNNSNNNNCNNITNSHNKAFNLNFFLNETCKDAMNIGEFVDSLKLQLADLEKVGEAGYIEGISSIIVKNLKQLDVTKRPVHCTDKKRETVYIKDENKWEKDEDKSQMHKLIKRVVSKNMKMFEKYRDAHPDCLKYHSKYSDQYNKIVYESMGGKGDNDNEKHEKIIKNVLKEVTIDKNI
jgi:hypothetical protein